MKKKLLICGSSKNLGKFLAKKFKKTYTIIELSRSFKTNIHKNVFNCDLSDSKNTYETIKIIEEKNNSIDFVLFCAGDSTKNFRTNENVINIKKSLDSNFFVFVNFLESFKKIFSKNKQTNIIVISSIASTGKVDAPIEYSLSKNILNFYSKIMARQLIKNNIKINIISPGNILMKGNNWDKKIKKNKLKVNKYIKSKVPSNKFCSPTQIYNLCNLLMLNNGNFVGSNIIMDGGQIL